ncbi:MAG: fibronectin type III domain-containing protein [Acidimicrobiales bacterium]
MVLVILQVGLLGVGNVTLAAPVGTVLNFTGAGISGPVGITRGPDGAMWFSNGSNDSIGRIAGDGTVTNFTGVGVSSPFGITAGSDGNIWFTNAGNNSIGRITPAGVVSNFTGAGISGVRGISLGPDNNLWFTNSGNDSIGRITPAGVVSNFHTAGMSVGFAITAGPDGNLWYTGINSIGRLTTSGVMLPAFTTSIYEPIAIASAPDGYIWYSSSTARVVGRVSVSGAVTNYFASAVGTPHGIAAGPDGNMWFNSTTNNTVRRINNSGVVTSFSGPGISSPEAIAPGSDGRMWFTNLGNNSIGSATAANVASAPARPWAAAGVGMATISWEPPADGGSPITGYSVTALQGGAPSGQTCTASAPATSCDVTGLANGTAYTFTVTATNAVGDSAASSPSALTVPDVGSLFHSLSAPIRILDSRPPPEQVGPYSTPWTAGTVRDVLVAGLAGVPADATAVTLNVTVTGATAPSFLTLWPKGQGQPTASNLNWATDQTIPNAVTVKVGLGGSISVFNASGDATVIIDAVGYFDHSGSAAGFVSQAPVRILDSRPPPEQVGPYSTPWGPGTDRLVAVAGSAGVPVDAEAVVLNATVTSTTAESFLTLYPDGSPAKPTASSLNWKAGVTIPNAVTVKIGTGGNIRVFNNSGSANVILDVVGYFRSGSGDPFHPVAPVRFQDSRPGTESVGAYTTPWGTATTRTVSVLSSGAAPSGATAVIANFTVTSTSAESFAAVWNTGAAKPTASSLNWKAGTTIANAVTAKVGDNRTISVFNNSGSVNVIADIAGWYG